MSHEKRNVKKLPSKGENIFKISSVAFALVHLPIQPSAQNSHRILDLDYNGPEVLISFLAWFVLL